MDNSFIDRNDVDDLNFVRKVNTYLEGHKGFIAGGCFKNLAEGTEIKDVDIYFVNEADWAEADAFYRDSSNYIFSYENDKVRAYKNKRSKIRVELIRVYHGEPEEIIDMFDFTVTKFAYYKSPITIENDDGEEEESYEYRIVHHNKFFEHLHMKRLVIDNQIIRPGSTYERTYKYYGYGYKLCKESKVKVIEALRSGSFTPDDLSASLYDGMD